VAEAWRCAALFAGGRARPPRPAPLRPRAPSRAFAVGAGPAAPPLPPCHPSPRSTPPSRPPARRSPSRATNISWRLWRWRGRTPRCARGGGWWRAEGARGLALTAAAGGRGRNAPARDAGPTPAIARGARAAARRGATVFLCVPFPSSFLLLFRNWTSPSSRPPRPPHTPLPKRSTCSRCGRRWAPARRALVSRM